MVLLAFGLFTFTIGKPQYFHLVFWGGAVSSVLVVVASLVLIGAKSDGADLDANAVRLESRQRRSLVIGIAGLLIAGLVAGIAKGAIL
jgi:hypothetical protein